MNDPEFPSKLVQRFSPTTSPILTFALTNDGNYLLCSTSSSNKNSICLYNPFKPLLIYNYNNINTYDTLSLSFTTDSLKFASAGVDKAMYIVDISTGQTICRLRGHLGKVNSVQFNYNNTTLISGSYDSTIKIWDLLSNKLIQTLTGFTDSVSSVLTTCYSIIGCSIDGTIRVYDIRTGNVIVQSTDNKYPITSISIIRNNEALLASLLDKRGRLCLFDINSVDIKDNMSCLNSYTGHQNLSMKLDNCISYDTNYVISGSEDGSIYYWPILQEDESINTIKDAHNSAVNCLKYHPTQHFLFSGSTDSFINVYSL